jgi:hypothetical protein
MTPNASPPYAFGVKRIPWEEKLGLHRLVIVVQIGVL